MIGIVGTGLSGMTLAVALAQRGFDITLIGAEPLAQDDLRTTAILHPNIDFLKSLTVWSSSANDVTPLMTLKLVDGADTYAFHAEELELNEFGFNIRNNALQADLLKQIAKAKNITWHKTTLKSLKKNPSGWDLSLSNTKKISVPLVIGADGRNSIVRTASGIEIDEKTENQSALVTVLTTEKNHHFTSMEWYRAGGPFTTVPMPGKQLAIVWCDPEEILQNVIANKQAAIATMIEDITEGQYGKVTIAGKTQIWPVRPMKTKHLTTHHLALVGEAAHTLPPIGAQGFNTSLSDIVSLTDCLAYGRSLGLPVYDASILNRYERQRLPEVTKRYHSMTRLNDLIRTQNPALKMLRRVSLKTIHAIAPVKNGLMRATMRQAS